MFLFFFFFSSLFKRHCSHGVKRAHGFRPLRSSALTYFSEPAGHYRSRIYIESAREIRHTDARFVIALGEKFDGSLISYLASDTRPIGKPTVALFVWDPSDGIFRWNFYRWILSPSPIAAAIHRRCIPYARLFARRVLGENSRRTESWRPNSQMITWSMCRPSLRFGETSRSTLLSNRDDDNYDDDDDDDDETHVRT